MYIMSYVYHIHTLCVCEDRLKTREEARARHMCTRHVRAQTRARNRASGASHLLLETEPAAASAGRTYKPLASLGPRLGKQGGGGRRGAWWAWLVAE
jgi:hypothetical protein